MVSKMSENETADIQNNENHKTYKQNILSIEPHANKHRYKIVGHDPKRENYFIIFNKYGELSCQVGSLKKGKKPSIQSAIDKNEYLRAQVKEVQPI